MICPEPSKNETIKQIASKILGLETLEPRNRDCLDFHELGIGQIKLALEAAFEAGSGKTNDKVDTIKKEWKDVIPGDVVFFGSSWREIFEIWPEEGNIMVVQILRFERPVEDHVSTHRLKMQPGYMATCRTDPEDWLVSQGVLTPEYAEMAKADRLGE